MKKTEDETESGHQLVYASASEAELAWGLEEFEAKWEQAGRYEPRPITGLRDRRGKSVY